MRKILLLLFLFMISIVPVQGMESDQAVLRKYKYYRLNKVLGPLVFKDQINNDFPLIDETLRFEGELSELSPIKPNEMAERKIYEYDGFHYLQIPKINQIEIKIEDDTKICNISIENNNGSINLNDNSEFIDKDNPHIYELNGEFFISDLTIRGDACDGKSSHSFYVYFRYNDKLISEMGVTTFSDDIMLLGSLATIKNNAYKNIYSLTQENTNDSLIYQGKIKLYQYSDYKYQSYRLDKEYYNDYLLGPLEDYIYKDESDYIDIVNTVKIDSIPLSSNTSKTFYGKEILNNQTESPVLLNTKKNDNSEKSSNKQETKKIDNALKETPQYQHILKMDNNKLSKHNNSLNNIYYGILFILIILLFLMIKLRNNLKKSTGWY